MLWNEFILSYYQNLRPPRVLPGHIQWLFPQEDAKVLELVDSFAKKFYCDSEPRRLLLGINPGRFGAGVTGINFTAPRQLKEELGIDHPFKNSSELSAEFIYQMIREFGGPGEFYSRYFIGAVSPLGFVKDGKNINYYDDPALLKLVESFIIENLEKLVAFNVKKDVCFSIGGEKNFKYLTQLNSRKRWFEKIIPLPHPRFIMQYRRKFLGDFLKEYLTKLREYS